MSRTMTSDRPRYVPVQGHLLLTQPFRPSYLALLPSSVLFSRRRIVTSRYALTVFTILALAGRGDAVLVVSPPALAAAPLGVVATPGTNLVQNGGAESGDRSDTGWDAVTIPGWQIVSGLPSVIGYGTKSFIAASSKRPSSSGHQLFVGGAGGPAVMSQRIALRAAGSSAINGSTFTLLRGARWSDSPER